ncbi:RhoGAP domain-containing protein [Hamiltosporidium tvaerminnensis]|uniref:RhoGAP domain-containing protein n=1 Tax=Hamiltosporidium tvaerminnensis TaxID=1176355 RepID=A0A4Q9LXI6_9MICR|nr:RhoGAP domain-containing protein [Hamiltosporidium tvaerminnensis]
MIGKIKNFQVVQGKFNAEKKHNKNKETPFTSSELLQLMSNLKKTSSKQQNILPVYRHLQCHIENHSQVRKECKNTNSCFQIVKKESLVFKYNINNNYLYALIENTYSRTNIDQKNKITVQNIQKNDRIQYKKPIKALEFKPENKIYYSKLSNDEKESLKKYCRYMLREKPKKSSGCIINMIKGFFMGKKRSEVANKKDINPFIYNVGNYILKEGIKTEGIFRISGRSSLYKSVPYSLKENCGYKTSEYTIHDNASIFKAYIRDVLNGLVPEFICKELLETFKGSRNAKSIEEIVIYTIFCLDDMERELLLYLRRMFREIENYKDYNKMTMENLVKIFTPTLFPDFKPFDLTMIDKQIDFIKLLFESDFEEVPIDLLNAAHPNNK